jgi:maltose O-acetyltransferase
MLWKIRKRLMKFFAKYMLGNNLRILCLKLAGYNLGKDVYIGEDLIIIDELEDKGRISIGDRVSFAERVTLVISSYPNNSRILPYINKIHGRIEIKNDAWLGTGSIIFPNVTIGEGAIVGAGAVVTKSVPDFTVVLGSPARPVRKLDIGKEFYETDDSLTLIS